MSAPSSSDPSVSAERRAEMDAICSTVVMWAGTRREIAAVGLAGSWARGTAGMDSDADIVVLTDTAEPFIAGDAWVSEALGRPATLVRTQRWGVLTERRLRLVSGFEIEFGFASSEWATEPVDKGTARVVADAFRVLHDPQGILGRLVDAVDTHPGATPGRDDQGRLDSH